MTTAALLIGAVAGIYYGYSIPAQDNAVYNVNLAHVTNAVLDDSKHLVDTASLPLFNDLNEQPTICKDNAAKVTQAIGQFNGYLNNLDKLANTTRAAALYDLGRDAAVTKARQARAAAMVKQSRQVLADYAVATTFLNGLADIRGGFVAITTPLTQTLDLYDYYYRTAELRTDADTIDALAARIILLKPPQELAAIQASIAALYKEAAAGYRDLADGLGLGADTYVYAAAHRIETAMDQLDNNVQSQYAAVMQSSVLMKELGELPDKYVLE